VPIVARFVWADDGEHVDTVALGWTGRDVYVRMSDGRYRVRAVWLDAADVTRRSHAPSCRANTRAAYSTDND
jgi:hypothetical protein